MIDENNTLLNKVKQSFKEILKFSKFFEFEGYKYCKFRILSYITLKKSSHQMAKECEVCNVTILNWLRKFNIRARTISEALIGEKAPKWKGNDVKNLSYNAIHKRIEKIKPKPKDGKCEICHEVIDKYGYTKLCLSNIKDQNYTLNPDDYLKDEIFRLKVMLFKIKEKDVKNNKS